MAVDVRILRLEQGIVTVVLLTGFVFGIGWAIPVGAAVVGLDLALGSAGPVPRLWRAAIANRGVPPHGRTGADAVRLHQLMVGAALVVATLLWLAEVSGLAMLVAILVATVSALCATGLSCVGCELRRRMSRGD